MNRGTLRQVLPIAADVHGLDIVHFRGRLVDRINEARYLLLTFADAREAFFKESGVTAVRCHRWSPADKCGANACQNRQQPHYYAITLPPAISSLDDVRDGQDHNLRIYAEFSMGTYPDIGDCAAVRMTDTFYLDTDPPKGEHIFFFPESEADHGKVIGVEYETDCCGIQREDVRLTADGGTTSVPIAHIRSLTLPMDREGWIRVMSLNGQELARYHPGASPDRVRYAVHGYGMNSSLRWWGTREIITVCFDNDQVEFADPTLWRRLLRFQKLDDKENRNRSEESAYQATISFIAGQIEQALAQRQGPHEHLNYRNAELSGGVFEPLQRIQNMNYGLGRKRRHRPNPWNRN